MPVWLLSVSLLVLAGLGSCERDKPEQFLEAIVVYASYEQETYLPELFAEFTAATRIPVIVRNDDSAIHAQRLIHNIGKPPVDVFISSDIANLLRVADEGALRPILADSLDGVPASLRDAAGYWVALNYQGSVIAHRSTSNDNMPHGVADLADSQYEGRLCVSSSAIATNRLVIAMMIADIGAQQTEIVVRRWMQNLSQAPFQTEAALLAAIDDAVCEFGILSGWQAGISRLSDAATTTQVIRPQPGYRQIEGVGVARHSRHPDYAQQLVSWLLSEGPNKRHAEARFAYPVSLGSGIPENGQPVSVAGWRDQEARLLAERAHYP